MLYVQSQFQTFAQWATKRIQQIHNLNFKQIKFKIQKYLKLSK